MNFHKNDNGTVPVRFTRFYGGYGANEIAGFPEEIAKDLVESKKAASFINPDGTPFVPVVDEDEAEAEQINASPAAGATIEIPDNWREKHHLARNALAMKISGSPVPTDEAAIAIIEAELARRSGA